MALSGATKYNKHEGIISLSEDVRSITWKPKVAEAAPSLLLPVSTITNLQQTKEDNPKVMLKIVATPQGSSDPANYVFNFTAPGKARADADAIRDALAKKIEAAKSTHGATAPSLGGASAAMAIANAISSGASSSKRRWEDDEALKSDFALQQSLFKTNPALRKTFIEAKNNKPESIPLPQFTAQFWAPRIHLLRAHAIEKDQQLGSYNVLSKIDPRASTMSLSAEQIHLIFSQYPIVQRIYNKEVPNPLDEAKFWSHFFKSKLFKKLRGLQLSKDDATDKYFDKYLDEDEATRLHLDHTVQVPHIIDVEGNEENHSQRKGNAPDISMRPNQAKLPLFRSLNALSEQLVSHVTPVDADPSQPIGIDEATFKELRLRDLEGHPDQSRVRLNIQNPSLKEPAKDAEATVLAKNPRKTVQQLRSDSKVGRPVRKFDGPDQENFSKATQHIFSAIRERRLQTGLTQEPNPLPSEILNAVEITHATTNEFLSQFWYAFLSGDPDRAMEIAALKETLEKSTERMKAVADKAEEERKKAIEIQKEKMLKALERKRQQGDMTKKKARLNYDLIQGGADIVNQLLASTKKAVEIALAKYDAALREEEHEHQRSLMNGNA